MRLLLINPNSTASMTDKAAAAAKRVVRTETQIVAVNPANTPASIQGYYDAAVCLSGMLHEISRHRDVDGVVICCFDDTGLDAARCLLEVPVIGIGEAAFHAASFLATRFSVITTLGRSVPGIEANLQRYGLSARCQRVRATEIPVLALEEHNESSLKRIREEISTVIQEDGAEAIVLGCAGMADLMESLSAEFKLPIIDGITAAVTFVEALVIAGLKTSKIGGYATPVS